MTPVVSIKDSLQPLASIATAGNAAVEDGLLVAKYDLTLEEFKTIPRGRSRTSN